MALRQGHLSPRAPPSCEQDVVLDIRTGLFEFTTPAGPAASPVTLVLDGLDLGGVSIDGAALWRLNATEGEPEDGSLMLRQPEESSLNGRDQSNVGEIARAAGAIRSIDVPAGSEVTIKVSESDLIVTIAPSAAGPLSAPCKASVSVGRGWRLESMNNPGVLGPFGKTPNW